MIFHVVSVERREEGKAQVRDIVGAAPTEAAAEKIRSTFAAARPKADVSIVPVDEAPDPAWAGG